MVELISIHIPKTAGRSFHEVLKQAYGTSLDKRYEKEHFFPDMKLMKYSDIKLPDNIRAIHGHLTVAQIKHLIHPKSTRVITWVRNPLDRIISNYYYFMKRIRDSNTSPKQKKKAYFSLLEYAAQPKRRNKMSEILKGIAFEDFFFIGIMEQFEYDVKKLCSLMEWPQDIKVPHFNEITSFKLNNNCTTQYCDIDEGMKQEIARLNTKDMLLYAEIKKIRGQT